MCRSGPWGFRVLMGSSVTMSTSRTRPSASKFRVLMGSSVTTSEPHSGQGWREFRVLMGSSVTNGAILTPIRRSGFRVLTGSSVTVSVEDSELRSPVSSPRGFICPSVTVFDSDGKALETPVDAARFSSTRDTRATPRGSTETRVSWGSAVTLPSTAGRADTVVSSSWVHL